MVVIPENRVGFFNAASVCGTLLNSDCRVTGGVGVPGTPAEANVFPSFSAQL